MTWQALWDFLSDPDNRTVLAWLGGGILAAIVAILTVIQRSSVVKADRGSAAVGRDYINTRARKENKPDQHDVAINKRHGRSRQ
jgi:hypothetical protein